VRHLTVQQVSASLDGALSGVSLELVVRHLAGCHECRERHARLTKQDDALRRLLACEFPDLYFEDMLARLAVVIDAESRGQVPPEHALPPELPPLGPEPQPSREMRRPSQALPVPALPGEEEQKRRAAEELKAAEEVAMQALEELLRERRQQAAPPAPEPVVEDAAAAPPVAPEPVAADAAAEPAVASEPATAPPATDARPSAFLPAELRLHEREIPADAAPFAPTPPVGPPHLLALPPELLAALRDAGEALEASRPALLPTPEPEPEPEPVVVREPEPEPEPEPVPEPVVVREPEPEPEPAPAPRREPTPESDPYADYEDRLDHSPPKHARYHPPRRGRGRSIALAAAGVAALLVALAGSGYLPAVIRVPVPELPKPRLPRIEVVRVPIGKGEPAAPGGAAARTPAPAEPFRDAAVATTSDATPVVVKRSDPQPPPAAGPEPQSRPRPEPSAAPPAARPPARTVTAPAETPVRAEPKPAVAPRPKPAAPAPAAAEPEADESENWPLLCGMVVDETGAPVAGARVSLADLELAARTDRRGRFCIAAPPGDRTLSVIASGFAGSRRVVSLGADGLEVSIALVPAAPAP